MKKFWLVALIFLLSIILHVTIQQSLFSFIPLSLTVPFFLTWLVRKPLWFLLAWAVCAELFTTLPFGILTAVTLTPLLIHWLFQRIEIDISFSFLLITLATVFFQILLMAGYEILQLATISQLPWTRLAFSLVLTTVFTYSMCLLVKELHPLHE